MIEPRLTAVSARRYLALLIDSALVAAAGLGTAYLRSEDFAIVGRDDAGDPLVDPAEFGRMEELLDFELFGQSEVFGVNLVRAQEIADSVRVFGAQSYQWGMVAAALASLIVFYTIPAMIQRTIGMLPFGLEIRDIDGHRATLGAHLKRSLAGVIDMLPIIVPGLIGAIAASFSPRRQRIGDRIAGTVVVDRKLAAFYTSTPDTPPLTLRAREEATATNMDSGDGAGDDGAGGAGDTDRPERFDEPAPAEPAAVVDTTPTPLEPTPAEPPPTRAKAVNPAVAAPLPPPPVHRTAPSERPRPIGSDRPPATGGSERSANESLDTATSVVSTDQSAAETVDASWKPPRVEPAPVWQPAPFDPGPVEAPVPNDSRTLDDVLVGEPTVGELISADPVVTDDQSDDDGAPPVTGRRKAPVWSDKWRAWMYWDPVNNRWLRHDTSTNSWTPVD